MYRKIKENFGNAADGSKRPQLSLVRPIQGPPEPTYQQRQHMRQRALMAEIARTAPPRIPSWSEMYPALCKR